MQLAQTLIPFEAILSWHPHVIVVPQFVQVLIYVGFYEIFIYAHSAVYLFNLFWAYINNSIPAEGS